jgi:hypothetical protein
MSPLRQRFGWRTRLPSSAKCRPTRRSMSSSTTMLPTSTRRYAVGSHAIHASPSTSRRLRVPGPTRSKVGLPGSPGNASSAVSSPRSSTPDRHQPLHRRGQRQTQAIRLDQIRRSHPRRRPARETSIRSYLLASAFPMRAAPDVV